MQSGSIKRFKRRSPRVVAKGTQIHTSTSATTTTNTNESHWRRRLKSNNESEMSLLAECNTAAPLEASSAPEWARKRKWRRLGLTEANKQRACGLLGQLLILLVIIHQVNSQTSASSKQQQGRRLERRATDSSRGSFCQPQTVGNQQQEATGKKVFCFYDIQDDFRPQELNPCLCTHVVYSYVAVRKNLSFIAGKKGDLRSLASLKRKNPNLKLLVSLRPDDFFSFDALPTTPTTNETSAGIKQPAAAMNEMHQKFAKRIRDFIVRHSLDGINLDWPYFGQTLGAGNASRDHLTLTLQAIDENFQSSLGQSSPSGAYLRLLQAPLVTLTVSKDFYSLVDAYDFHAINKLVDFVHLPAFDFDLNVDQFSIGHPARLHGIFDAENLDTLVDLLLSSGLPSHQLVAGVPAHGVQITSRLANSTGSAESPKSTVAAGGSNSSSASSSSSLDEQLEAAASISIVSHAEVCRVRDLARQNCTSSGDNNHNAADKSCWTMSRSRDLTAPFAYDSEHWIGFDDETSAKLKAKYVLLRHLAGVALFTANHDDPQGQCGFGPFPLLSVINGVFSRQPASTSKAANSQLASAASTARGYFTRAPSQPLTATSLVSQIFGTKTLAAHKSAGAASAASNSADLMQSASEEVPRNHQQETGGGAGSMSQQTSATNNNQLMSFVDIIEKYGSVQRLDARGQLASGSPASAELTQDGQDPDSQLPCERVGYQRYPRDCSRFYRCVQTPPITGTGSGPAQANADNQQQGATKSQVASSSITRLQYECPSGLVFDEQFQICNWPSWSAQCSGSGEVNSITNSKFVCPNYGYFQNQENCEYFYYCSDYNRGTTQAYQFRCPFELGFDEEKLQCNWKWLVKGCSNSTTTLSSSATQSSSTNGSSSTTMEMAQKYLASLESSTTSKPTDSSAPIDRNENTTTTTTTISSTEPQATGQSTSAVAPQAAIEKRSLELDEDGDEFSGRGFTASIGSHVSSLLASVAAIREHRMKKANHQASGTSHKSKPSTTSDESSGADSSSDRGTTKPASKYPSYIGLPQLASAPSSELGSATSSTGGLSKPSTGFRLRRRQQQQQPLSSPSSFEGDKQSVAAHTPYRRRPPPPSMFSFLPNSAIYMLADSLRSVGEAASDEINRYMRIAGDRMRELLGHRGPGGKLKHKQRRSDDNEQALESALTKLALKLSSGGAIKRLSVHNDGLANQANYHALVGAESQVEDQKRTKRVRRSTAAVTIDEMEDLQALESGPSGQQVYVAAAPPISHHAPGAYQIKPQQQQQQQHQHYNDPLGRPPGYPLNALDSAAKQAVLGPEPKLFSQPSHLIINQLSGISQADYERLIRPPSQRHQQYKSQQLSRPPMTAGSYVNAPPQHEPKSDSMMSAASEQVASQTQFIDHSKVIDRILGQAREAFAIGPQPAASGQQESAIPFGMPAMVVRPPTTKQHEENLSSQETRTTLPAGTPSQKPSPQQKRRSTVAMKLAATLALPKFSLLPTTTTTSTSAPPPTTTTGQPSSEREKASSSSKYMSFLPNFIVNKAIGFNRAVQDLISTLAPGSSSKFQHQQTASTPKMPQILPNEHQARLQQHFKKQHMQMQTTPLPLAPHNFHNGQHSMMQQQQQQQQHRAVAHQMQHHHHHHQQQPNQAEMFNRTNGPLLLTESEARALSAQLDQLSKEQLEALSADLFKNDQSSLRAQIGQEYQQQVQQAKQQAAESAPPAQQQQQPTPTESPDYVVRLLRMISQTSHNPEDVRLLEQLTSQLNNPRPNGQDQSLIEIGQPDDLALLEALGMIPNQPPQPPQQQQKATFAQAANAQASDVRPEASYTNYQMTANEMVPQQQQQHPYAHPGGMKPLLYPQEEPQQVEDEKHMSHVPQQSKAQSQLREIDGMPPLEIDSEHLGTTKFVPVALEVQQEVTTPTPYYLQTSYRPQPSYQPKQTYPPSYKPQPPVSYYPKPSYHEPPPQYPEPSYSSEPVYSVEPQYEYYTTTTTTTTTTTPRPTQLVTQVFEQQQVEKQVPPVRQTYTELIENNVTTPDGIETTIESRTKSAISGGAAFGIGTQVGLGMVPTAFGGSVPSDSPMSEQQARQQEQQSNGTTSNSSSSISESKSNETSSSSSTKLEEKQTKELTASEKQAATKGGAAAGELANMQQQQQFGSFSTSSGGGQQMAAYSLNSANLNNPDINNAEFLAGLSEEQRQAIFNSQEISSGQNGGAISSVESGALGGEVPPPPPLPQDAEFGLQQNFQSQQQQLLPSGEQRADFTSGQFATGSQQTQFGPSGSRTSTDSRTNQVLLQGAQQPLTSRQTQTRFSGAQAPGGSLATLSSYNFATQPINQMEEVVIKKKFKPFPKTMIVPQTSTFTIEEVRGGSKQQAQPQIQQEISVQQQTEQQQQQQVQQSAVSATDFNSNQSSASQQTASRQEQIKEDEFSTVASTFGENEASSSSAASSAAATSALSMGANSSSGSTAQSELQRQQQIANELKMIERQLQQQEASGQPIETLDPNSQLERESGRLQSASSGADGGGSASTKVSRKSSKKSRKSNQKQRASSETNTTTRPAAETVEESSTAKRSVEDEDGAKPKAKSSTTKRPRGASGNRVEEAFSNFMVELQRSRKPSDAKQTSTTTTSSPTTTTTSTNRPADSIDSSSSEQRSQRRRSRSKKARHGQRVGAASSSEQPAGGRKQTPNKSRRQNNNRAKSALVSEAAGEPREREVAIYGTKSGFMPIIDANDPSYATQPEIGVHQMLGNQLGGSDTREQLSDPLSFGASFTSSKRQTLGEQDISGSARKPSRGQQQQRRKMASSATSDSWQNYVRKLNDQISVVHLGNYSERTGNHTARLIQVKLVILPSSPNNQLLNPRNWQHLASNYPALFPRSLDELRVETMDLGEPSIQLQNGGLIDEHIERARHATFRAKYERVSELIEPKTFKALDEIVQRSSGQLFMIQRRDSLDRTIIAVIPDRPFIRSAMSSSSSSSNGGATGGYQRLVLTPNGHPKISTTPSTTSTSTTSTTTTSATPTATKDTTPQKAATFSRAIQESIQEAIRQHYDSMKSQLRQSMVASGDQLDASSSDRQQQPLLASSSTTTTSDEEYNRLRNWSTPAADALARIESTSNLQAAPLLLTATEKSAADPMEAASSSTEYSVVMAPNSNQQQQQQPAVVAKESYGSQAMYEVEGAEPKTLYGLELNSNERQQYEQERVRPLSAAPEVKADASVTTESSVKATLAASQAPKTRFISIGSHLMASPMKKIVDQAYVNHFYDHISDHQLAKSIGFDELLEQQQQQQTQNSTSVVGQQQPQQMSETIASSKPEGDTEAKPAEESLVPESACTRAGLFQHPFACNKFYECFWDKQLNKYTLHMFECPIKLAFDERIVGCAMPIESSLCVNM